MKLKIYPDYAQMSDAAADAIIMVVKEKSNAVICLPTGNTPTLTYELLVRKSNDLGIDFSKVILIGLDEWLGISATTVGSCNHFFNEHLIKHLNFSRKNIYLFDGLTNDPEADCHKINLFIETAGGIDLMVVGIGMNGHIGFNEPGASFDEHAHVTRLHAITIEVGQKYFNTEVKLEKGITLGLRNLLESRNVIMLANGRAKAAIIRQTLEQETSTLLPSTIMQLHDNSALYIDEEAASLLTE
ncbi:MAG: glucosamine-6-phosphate deaminase [Chitinophagaceae bacterium]|nr:glucosamine-6-phosphate deaminase [Chitinophagaceae bacterium]